MSSSSRIFVLWALFVMLVAAVEWTIFTHHSPNYYLLVLLPAFAVGATIALALLAAPRGRCQEAQARPTVATDLSMPSALIGIALVVMLWGSFIGEWLLLIGAGLLVLGAGGLSRELLLVRSLHQAAIRGEPDQPGSA